MRSLRCADAVLVAFRPADVQGASRGRAHGAVMGEPSHLVVRQPRRRDHSQLFESTLQRRLPIGPPTHAQPEPGTILPGWATQLLCVMAIAVALILVPVGVRASATPTGCEPLHLDVAGAPNEAASEGFAAAVRDVQVAVPQLEILVTPPTSSTQPTITVRWVDTIEGPGTSDSTALGYTQAGVGTPAVRSTVTLLASAALPATGPGSWELIARHELGHALGLEHATTPGDPMFPLLEGMGSTWSTTERAHLDSLGRAPACRL